MRSLLCLLLIVLSLPAAALADVPLDLYVSTTGNDTANNCQQVASPCKTVKHALTEVSHGAPFIIKTARGTYEIQGTLLIPSGTNVTVEGGWNRSFTAHSCSHAETNLITGQHGAGYPAFEVNTNVTEKTDLTLRCMTIRPSTHYAFDKAVIVISNHALAQLHMEHIRMTGFSIGPVVLLAAQEQGTVSATLNETILDHNHPGSNILEIDSNGNDGAVNCSLNKVQIVNNQLDKDKFDISVLNRSLGGTFSATIKNSIIAASTGKGVGIFSRSDSQNSLRMINSTLTDNPHGELRVYADETSTATASLTNCIIKNNYTYWKDISAEKSASATATITADHCILGDHEEINGATFISSSEVQGNPMLDSTFHVKKGSPAIDAGICGHWDPIFQQYHRVAPYDDIDGDKRPGNNVIYGCDIGADEYKPFPWPMFLPAIEANH